MALHLSAEEPVLDAATLAAKVTAFIGTLGALFTILGFASETDWAGVAQAAGAAVLAIAALVGAVLPIINAVKARAKVTPLANPKDAQGVLLTPAGS